VTDGVLARRPARGRHEVVIHSPRHVRSLAELAAEELTRVARAWQARAAAAREAGYAYLHALVNEGAAAGASLAHSHSQLVWLPEVPPEAAKLRLDASACSLCALLAAEQDARVRIVDERDGLVVVGRFAARLPYELLIAPAAHEPVGFGDRLPLALELLTDAVRRLRALEGPLPLNAWLRSAPLQGGDFHWHLELLPRLTVPAGIELGAGYFVNTLAPEEATALLRG
jgi:UDPglucose--hexose-1-phosphate uridylyltransferase